MGRKPLNWQSMVSPPLPEQVFQPFQPISSCGHPLRSCAWRKQGRESRALPLRGHPLEEARLGSIEHLFGWKMTWHNLWFGTSCPSPLQSSIVPTVSEKMQLMIITQKLSYLPASLFKMMVNLSHFSTVKTATWIELWLNVCLWAYSPTISTLILNTYHQPVICQLIAAVQ